MLREHAKEFRKVASIWFTNENGDNRIIARTDVNLHIEDEYCGDRSEIWIVQTNDRGIETARYNTRFIAEINWET